MKGKCILYVQHAGAMGGSVVSLRELVLDAVQQQYRCVVACPNQEIADVYRAIGAEAFVTPIMGFNHNTALFYKATVLDILRFIKMLLMTRISFWKMRKIVKAVRPDIVHLNSSVLILYALFFRRFSIPVIYHVRENVVQGYFGWRKSFIRKAANKWAAAIIYISEYEFELLGTDLGKSTVIYNYVHEHAFQQDAEADNRPVADQQFKIVILGGLFNLKGGKTILESLMRAPSEVELLVLGGVDPREKGAELSALESKTYFAEIVALLNRPEVGDRVKFYGRVSNPAKYISRANALLFWAAAPHFPRPVFEAWLLEKPVLYYNPLFKNPIINERNVSVVQENTPDALAKCIQALPGSSFTSAETIAANYAVAKANFTEQNFLKIDAIYRQHLSPE
ncbi:Glycosyltransferase involved in cell wall bisynthesis [Chryseolinea serpens]|uniref:Glycosyltransferase involved in cell wall bisynthesis n=2 Tax=Chryseolinea serpens TaxID=947013 RepID=A0A1M5NS21_9BACT|nr:Glycosyltransferase involved in cell wall bisynthesis [Chryseolinea serpens]